MTREASREPAGAGQIEGAAVGVDVNVPADDPRRGASWMASVENRAGMRWMGWRRPRY